MQVHGPSLVIKDPAKEVRAMFNGPGLVVVRIGHVDVHVHTAAEADVLIAAAVEAKRLIDPPAPGAMRDAGCYDITGRTA